MAISSLPSIRVAWFAVLVAGAALAGCDRSPAPSAAPEAPAIDVNQTKAKAEQGDAESERLLGDAYAAGRGVPRDYKQAVSWYRKAAEQGSAPAQNSLGELSEAGQGMPQSFSEAAEWYRKAAEKGNVAAAYNLAVLYAFGRGVRLDEAEAVRWYRKAAAQGNALAQFNLGQRYQLGKGVPADPVEAYTWLGLAAKSIPDAARFRDEVKSGMNRQQLAEARQRIDAFVPGKTNAVPAK